MHIGSQVFVADFFHQAVEVLAPFVNRFDLPELVLGGGLGVAYVEGEEAPTIAEWGRSVLDACAAAGITRPHRGRAGPVDRGRRRRHPLHGRHDQGAARASAPTSPSTAA